MFSTSVHSGDFSYIYKFISVHFQSLKDDEKKECLFYKKLVFYECKFIKPILSFPNVSATGNHWILLFCITSLHLCLALK